MLEHYTGLNAWRTCIANHIIHTLLSWIPGKQISRK